MQSSGAEDYFGSDACVNPIESQIVAHSVESAFKSIAVIVRDRRRMYSETPCPECGEYSRSVHCRYVAEINMLAQYVPANDVGKQIGGH